MSAAMAPVVAEGRFGGLALRTVSTLVMAPLAAFAVYKGFPYFHALVALGAGVLAWEWNRLCGEERFGVPGRTLLAVVMAAVASATLGFDYNGLIFLILGTLAVHQMAVPRGAIQARWLAGGVLYLGLPSLSLIWLHTTWGWKAVLWLFLAVWATDIGAYCVGRLIGGAKLAPRLSPNKTWAGLLGGMATAALTGAIMALAGHVGTPGLLAGLSAAVAVISQGGDLTESAFKRHFKVKDTSALIPGHGGLLDRVDGLLTAAPAAVLFQLVTGGSVLAWR